MGVPHSIPSRPCGVRPCHLSNTPRSRLARRSGIRHSVAVFPLSRLVVAAVKDVGLKVPLVVRLEGTNVEAGKQIIRDSGLNVIPADDLADAAQKIVKAVKGA